MKMYYENKKTFYFQDSDAKAKAFAFELVHGHGIKSKNICISTWTGAYDVKYTVEWDGPNPFKTR